MKKIKILSIITILIIGAFILGIYIGQNKNADRYNKQKMCYNYLYDNDEIKNGCQEYFKNDKWYNEYLKSMNNEDNKLQQI